MLFFPILTYPLKWQDVLAGLTVGIVTLPQAMAFSLLAGMPPIYGLYGAFVPSIIYAILGSSAFLNIGPVSVISIFVYSLVSPLHTPFSESYIQTVMQLGLLVGVVQIIAGFCGMGKFISRLPKSVISGFVQAAAIVIIVSQLATGFGLEDAKGSTLGETLLLFYTKIPEFQWISTSLFAGSLSVLFFGLFYFKQFPTTIVLLSLSGFCAYLFDWEGLGVSLIGKVPQGLPSFNLPKIDDTLYSLLPGAIGIALIASVGSFVMSRTLEKHQKNAYTPNRDIVVLGLSKVIASFFGALVSAGSFNRSILNLKVGAQSPYAGLFSASILVLTLLFLTPLVYFLPQPVIAAVIVYSVVFLFDFPLIINLLKNSLTDFFYLMATLGITLIFGFVEGITFGILLSYLVKWMKKQQSVGSKRIDS